MNLWIVAPRSGQDRLIEPLKDPGYRIFCSETTLAAFDAMPAGKLSADAFVIGGFDTAGAAAAVAAVRAHPTLWKTPILVVGDGFGVSDTIVLSAAGADFCYTLAFEPAAYEARVRALLQLRTEARTA